MTNGSLVVTLVDDDPDFCKSLSGLLKEAGYTVRSFHNGISFLKTDLTKIEGCVLLDVRMPIKDGLTVLSEALEINPRLYVVMMSGHGDIPMAVKALKLGALDFIEKPFPAAVLFSALEKIDEVRSLELLKHQMEIESKERVGQLSPRELEIAEKLTDGKSNKIIAFELSISIRTVEVHRAHVMSKLQARSLADLIKTCLAAKST